MGIDNHNLWKQLDKFAELVVKDALDEAFTNITERDEDQPDNTDTGEK